MGSSASHDGEFTATWRFRTPHAKHKYMSGEGGLGVSFHPMSWQSDVVRREAPVCCALSNASVAVAHWNSIGLPASCSCRLTFNAPYSSFTPRVNNINLPLTTHIHSSSHYLPLVIQLRPIWFQPTRQHVRFLAILFLER